MSRRSHNPSIGKRKPLPLFVVGMIEQSDDEFLIVRSAETPERIWHLPRGPAKPEESAEEAMRRVAREQLEIDVDIVIGQPPIAAEIEGNQVELRYFFCALIGGTLVSGPYAEFRWVPKAQLREYEYDAPTRPVVEWLLADRS